jgi:hypothetical protein
MPSAKKPPASGNLNGCFSLLKRKPRTQYGKKYAGLCIQGPAGKKKMRF